MPAPAVPLTVTPAVTTADASFVLRIITPFPPSAPLYPVGDAVGGQEAPPPPPPVPSVPAVLLSLLVPPVPPPPNPPVPVPEAEVYLPPPPPPQWVLRYCQGSYFLMGEHSFYQSSQVLAQIK